VRYTTIVDIRRLKVKHFVAVFCTCSVMSGETDCSSQFSNYEVAC